MPLVPLLILLILVSIYWEGQRTEKMCQNCLLILIGGNLWRMAQLSPAGWRYAVWGARWVGKSICSSAIMNHCCHCRWRYLKKSPALADLLPALPCLLTITLLRGCISGQMGPDDQHYHNLAHPKHTPILTIKCRDGFWEDSWTRIKGLKSNSQNEAPLFNSS